MAWLTKAMRVIRRLSIEALTQESFAPFGQVIETEGAERHSINQGTTTRFHRLATADTGDGGRAIVSIFRGVPRPFPIIITMLERHPLGSQAFMPLSNDDWLVVVSNRPESAALRCFRAAGTQGVQYAKGVWHHPLLVIVSTQDFLVVDREGPGDNVEEVTLPQGAEIEI
jgi:ureidoglycolate lyase